MEYQNLRDFTDRLYRQAGPDAELGRDLQLLLLDYDDLVRELEIQPGD